MLQKLKDAWNKASTEGVKVPFVYDSVKEKPSVTLLFTYVLYVMLLVSLIALHFKTELVIATAMVGIMWIVAVVFYLIRNLQKAKFDLDDRSVELEGEEDSESK